MTPARNDSIWQVPGRTRAFVDGSAGSAPGWFAAGFHRPHDFGRVGHEHRFTQTTPKCWCPRTHLAGDTSARDGLIRIAQGRFAALARAMLRRHPHVRRWEQTDDLLNAALARLHRSLAAVRPETVRHFDNLAATQVRRELIDLARSYHGPEGLGANHHTDGADPGVRLARVGDGTGRPETLERWMAFHEAVERLPEEEREVVGLIWYRGMTHAQAAEALGVATKTVRRRWASARLLLQRALDGERPEGD